MLRQFSIKRIAGFFLLDWLGTMGCLYLAAILRPPLGNLPNWLIGFFEKLDVIVGSAWNVYTVSSLLKTPLLVVVAVLWPFFFIVFSVYDGRHNDSIKTELLNVFLAICVATTALSGVLFFSYRETSRVFILLFFTLDVILLLGTRLALWSYRSLSQRGSLASSGSDRRRVVLIVGAGPVGRNAAEQMHKYAWSQLRVAGYLDDDAEKQGLDVLGAPVLGTLDNVAEIVAQYQIQDAVIALPLHAHERLVEICDILQKLTVQVHVIPDLFALSFPNSQLDGFGGIPVISLGMPGIHGLQRAIKRAFDVLAVSVGLVLISPVLLFVAIMIKLDSPGPVIYRQKRVGENGRPFMMLKFRSMRAGADTGFHQQYVTRLIQQNLTPEEIATETGQQTLKMENDPRITPIGRFIRKTSIDELPQLINVLRGEMSLVGPRPPLPYEVDVYQEWHRRRLEALPGITGLWQVKAHNKVSFDEMVRLDLEYIEKQSLWLDMVILFQTPWSLLTDRGAG